MTLTITAANYRFARSSISQVALIDCTDHGTGATFNNVQVSLSGVIQTIGVPATFSGVSITQFQNQALASIRPRLIGGNNGFP